MAAAPGNITINGPYWSAEAQVLVASAPGTDPNTSERSVMARLLFVDQTARPGRGKPGAYLPGTLLVLCSVRSVVITPITAFSYKWKRLDTDVAPDIHTADGITSAVHAGTAALLVLRGDPDQLAQGGSSFDCLDGEISLDGIPPDPSDSDAVNRLYRASGLSVPDGTVPPLPDYALRRKLSVHASGVSLYGMATFPWESQPLALPFQLAEVIPTGQQAAFRLTIEADRLTATEESQVIRSWRRLSGYLNPKHPLNENPAPPETPTPTWMTLELSNPLAVPRLYSLISPWKDVNPGDKTQRTLNIEPTEVNLLISDQQPYDRANPASSLARVTPQSIVIEPGSNGLLITVNPLSANPASEIQYSWGPDAQNKLRETIALTGLEVGFEPVQTSNFLRQQQGLPTPEWLPDIDNPQPIQQPVLWGFMPLENGWAELPFLNLTAQIFLDAKVEPENPPKQVAPFMLQGAAAIGNDHEAVLSHYRDEQPWNMTLTDAQSMSGTWTLTAANGGYTLTTVAASFTGPEATFNGLFWLSTGRPSAEDALPDLTDWVAGLESVPLKTVDPSFDIFPPPIVLKLSDFSFSLRDVDVADNLRPSAQMTAWFFSFETNPLSFDKLVDKKVIPANVFSELLPLLWQRHPFLPMIQALPLTQSKNPPTFPGASRQLAPFQLTDKPTTWTFTVAGTNAAQRWPLYQGELLPAVEWIGDKNQRSDLPLVALSLPGLVLDPVLPAASSLGNKAGLSLPAQYRFDLPYLDQLNALAQVPVIPRDPNEISPLPDQVPPAPPPPLDRTTYADHWEKLSEQASLAAADAVEAFLNQAGNQYFVGHLVEPYQWPTQPTTNTDAYPGSLLLEDTSTHAQQNLTGDAALKGVSGNFTLDSGSLRLSANGAGANAFQIDAGSMAAYPQNGGFRDQRGLLRRATARANDNLLQTPVQLERTLNTFDNYLLTSTLASLDLMLTSTTRWHFWFRDLPVNEGTSSFKRDDVRSKEVLDRDLDINDPEALAREYNYRQGYEWRLGIDGETTDFLDLGGLRFFPLTLEVVVISSEKHVNQVVLIGRLQLPLTVPGELTELSNAVQLTFNSTDDVLTLSAVDLVSPVGEWPLALTENSEIADAPLLLWGDIALKVAGGKSSLEVSQIELRYFLFDVEWVLPLQTPLTFSLDGANPETIEQVYTFDSDPKAPIYPEKTDFILSLTTFQHSCDVYINLQLGSRSVEGQSQRSAFNVEIKFPLLKDGAPVGRDALQPEIQHIALFNDIAIQSVDFIFLQGRSLQFHWVSYDPPPDGSKQYLLPGMALNASEATPGFAVVTFEAEGGFALDSTLAADLATSPATPKLQQAFATAGFPLSNQATVQPNGAGEWLIISTGKVEQHFTIRQFTRSKGNSYQVYAGVPALGLTTAFMEAMLTCGWGQFLQDPRPARPTAPLPPGQKLPPPPAPLGFGSSAGDVLFNYTASLQAGLPPSWDETFLLNGMVEVTNLISWPLTMSHADAQLHLPVLDATNLDHLRHTIRVMLNQHEIPPGIVVFGAGSLIFDFAEHNAWQFLAVVEHQLLDTHAKFSSSAWNVAYNRDRRWTALQEVRWASPHVFQAFLLSLPPGEVVNPFDVNRQATVTITAKGDDTNEDRDDNTPISNIIDNSPTVWLGTGNSTTGSYTGLRFTNVPIPSGAVVLSAKLHVVAQPKPTTGNPPPDMTIQMSFDILAEAADNSVAFSNTSRPSGRPLTTAKVSHSSNDTWKYDTAYDLPNDFASVLQEVVNRPGWRAGNSLSLIVKGAGTHTFARKFVYSFEGNPTKAPQLIVTYTLPAHNPYTYGYFDPNFRGLLTTALQQVAPDMLLVEASAPHWIKRVPAESTTSTSIQYLPFGAQAAVLSGPDDYKTSRVNALPDESDWLLLTMPFIGRIQPLERDMPVVSTSPNPLQVDPLVCLVSLPNPALRPLALALASWAESIAVSLNLLDFDTYVGRIFPRLDSLSLEENWMRLQNPLTEPTPSSLRSIAAALPPSPGRLSRSLALRRAADSFRPAYPPAVVDDTPPEEPTGDGLTWRQHSLIVFQSSTAPTPVGSVPYVWAFVGLQAIGGLPDTVDTDNAPDPHTLHRQRYASATLIPTPPKLKNNTVVNNVPVSFAVSPYLGLEMLYGSTGTGNFDPNADQAGAKSGELLCIDPTVGVLRPIASFIWEFKKSADVPGWVDMDWGDWAKGTHQLLASDSLICVLRFRELLRTGETSEAPLVVRYSYQLVKDIVLRPHLNQRTHRVRSSVGALRFRQGQHGGYALPTNLRAFEVAPPQTIGLQPVHMNQSPLPDEPWPWGVSGMRVSVQYTQDQKAVLDAVPAQGSEMTLWWQTVAPIVQFRSAEQSDRRAASLPHVFRAPAIKSLLPVLPNPPMPLIGTDQLGTVDNLNSVPAHGKTGWQSILPGLLRYLVTGSRAGVMFALRNILIRQNGLHRDGGSVGQSVVSGSVPAQHRFPRPVSLPPNKVAQRLIALQTWSSYFEPEQNSLVTTSPADEVFFGAFRPLSSDPTVTLPEVPARRFRLTLHDPVHGALPGGWNGDLTFDVLTDQPVPRLESWKLDPVIADASTRFSLFTTPFVPATFVPLMDFPAQWKTGDSIEDLGDVGKTLRTRLEAEGILQTGQPAALYPDARWTVQVTLDTDAATLLVYDDGDGLSVYHMQADQPVFVCSINDVTQQPGVSGTVSKPTIFAIQSALFQNDAFLLAAGLPEDKIKISKILPNPVRQHWIIAEKPDGQVFAVVSPLSDPKKSGFTVSSLRIRFSVTADQRAQLLSTSLALTIRARHETTTPGFDLTLNFPLNTVDQRRQPLPFEPYFVHFEDPEYNRLLASNAAHAAHNVKDERVVDGKSEHVGHTVTLATDRREYNADSEIAIRFDWDDNRNDATSAGTLQIGYLGLVPSQDPPLLLDTSANPDVNKKVLNSATLARYNLAALVQIYNDAHPNNKITLSPGDRVQIKIIVRGKVVNDTPTDVPIVLELPIIRDPVTPSPQAGYGLLRSSNLTDSLWVECARFAWTPDASRVEMVCAEDLRTEIVRRRATFQWRDTARPNRSNVHAVQKITLTGSTHFPWVISK